MAAVVAILGFGFVAWPWLEGKLDSGTARLEAGEIAVSNRTTDYRTGGTYLYQTRESAPTVEATVRNRGDETAWIEEAKVRVEDVARLTPCLFGGGGGDVPRTKPYRITLPEFLGVGNRVIRRSLHVEVEAGRAARPVLVFQTPDIFTEHLYAIRVELISGQSSAPIDLGRFVIGVPGPVSRYGALLPEDHRVLRESGATFDPLMSTWCYLDNLTAVRRLIAAPGRRSAQIAALDHMQIASNWRSYVDERPPRRVIGELLRSETTPEAPMFAVFAAERSHDSTLLGRVKQRVAALLTRRAREALDDYAKGAVIDAERALSLEPSDAARKLLWRARSRLQAEEEKLTEQLAES